MGIPATAIPAAHPTPFFPPFPMVAAAQPASSSSATPYTTGLATSLASGCVRGLGPAISDAPLTQPHAHTPTPHLRYTPHGFVSRHQTWAHLLGNTVIHPDHYIRRRASSFLDFRYCQDDLRVQICQVCVTCVGGVLMAAGAHSARVGSNALRATTAQNDPASPGRGPNRQGEPPQVPYHAVRLRYEPGLAGTPIHRNAGMVRRVCRIIRVSCVRVSCHACVVCVVSCVCRVCV